MRALHIIWTLFWNLVTLAIFFGMLSVANTSFQTIIVSGLALIYTTIITYSTIIIRTQIAQSYASTNRFVYLAKMNNDLSKTEELEDIEIETNNEWESFLKKNPIFYINMFFVCIIFLAAVFAIISAL